MKSIRIYIAICSVDRAEVLHQTVSALSGQTLQPEAIYICVFSGADVYEKSVNLPLVKILKSPLKGSSSQRNYAIEHIENSPENVVLFLDDDVFLESKYLEKMEQLFSSSKKLLALSAHVALDGGISASDAKRKMSAYDNGHLSELVIRSSGKHWVCHGCNMAFRRSILELERFDEQLPLYSYAEDYDLSVRVARHGIVGKVDQGLGVAHLAYSGGRVSEFRRGYSMVANNYYFLGKGVCHTIPIIGYVRFWAIIVLKETIHDFFMAIVKKGDLDYEGRARGRLLGVFDIMRRRSDPRRILEFSEKV